MKKETQKKGMSTGAVIGITAGVAALGAATYFFFGPNGKKNQKKVTGWMLRTKGEIVEKLENAKEVSEDTYHKIVDSVIKPYLTKKGANIEEIQNYATDLKKQWKSITKTVAPKKAVKKTAKKTTKK